MRLISRHILRALAAPFFWGVLALSGLLLLNQLALLIDRFGGRGLGFEVMIEAIVLALPALLTLTLPMSVLVATLYAYSTLAADLEMVAMYANGISVWRMVRPALLAAVGVATVNFLLFDQIVPLSNTRFRTLTADVYRKTPTLSLRPQQLNELPRAGYLIWAEQVEPLSGRLTEVTIYDLRDSRTIHADSGLIVQSANGRDLLMNLFDGEQLDFSSANASRVERTAFTTNLVRMVDATNEFERRQGQVTRGDREQSGCELRDGIDERRWNSADGLRQLAYLTRRDLRHLAGASPLKPPALRTRPDFDQHCTGLWEKLGDFFERLLLPAQLQAQEPQRPAPAPPAQDSTVVPGDSTVTQDSARTSQDSVRGPPDTAERRDSVLPALGNEGVRPISQRLGLRLRQTKDSVMAASVTQESLQAAPAQQGVGDGGDSATTQQLFPAGSLLVEPTEFLVNPEDIQPPETRENGVVASLSEVLGARIQVERGRRTANEYAVEYHKKFAIPLASFCFVLVGIALALKFPRSGIGLVIGASLIVFLGFYVMLIGGENIANDGAVSPEVAMYGPVAVFTLAGLLAVAMANREMGTARTLGIVDWIGGVVRRLRGRR